MKLSMPLAACLSSRDICDTSSDARWLESLGYRGLWVGEGRLRRDAVTQLTLAAAATRHVYLSSGIVPFRTRNVALLATTWKSLFQLAPGRVRIGLGAWWEPIAGRVGLHTPSPLTAMTEVVEALRVLFDGGEATIDGTYVQLERVAFDGVEDEHGAKYPIPIYMAAVGDRMLQLAGRIADGVLLDFFLPTDYIAKATERVFETCSDAGRTSVVDLPQLVACNVNNDDREQAGRELSEIFARYLAQQEHVALHCGVDPELIQALRSRYTWPATSAELAEAGRLIPKNVLRSVAAFGTTHEVVEKIEEYLHAGSSEVVVTPFGSDRSKTFEEISRSLRIAKSE